VTRAKGCEDKAWVEREEQPVKIGVVVPSVSKQFANMLFQRCSAAARPDTELSVVSVDQGPASIESRYDTAMAAPHIVRKIVQAEKDGMDAVVSP
jgi:allantoin racemase